MGGFFFVATYISLILPRGHGQFAPLGLLSGLMLAVLLLTRRSRWPALVAATYAGKVLAGLAAGSMPLLALGFSFAGTIECVVCALLLIRVLGPTPDLARAGTIGRYLAVAAASAALGGLLAAMVRAGLNASFGRDALIWFARDFTGMAALTPCLISVALRHRRWRDLTGLRAWPLALLLAVDAVVFLGNRVPLTFLVVSALLLVAWRLRGLGAAVGALMTAAIAITGTALGVGPFAMIPASVTERFLLLQLFITLSFHLSVPVAAQLAIERRLRDDLQGALDASTAAEARYRVIADTMRDIVVRGDRDGRVEFVSPSCRQLGYEPEELIGQLGTSIVHPDDVARIIENNIHFVSTGNVSGPRDRRYRFRAKDGSYHWFEGSPSLVTDGQGSPTGLISSFRDVSEHQAAHEALAASEARYRLLADNMTDVISCSGADGVLTFVSGGVGQMLGYEASELIGRQVGDMMHPEDVVRGLPLYERHAEADPGEEPFSFEYRLARKDGSYVWLESRPRAIFDAETGEFEEWLDVVRDITEHKALEDDLRAARTEAIAATRAKADFLADVGHELRGPLISMQGFARLVRRRRGLPEPITTYIERIEAACRALIVMVNEIQDFSKLEAAEIVFRPRPVAVSGLCGDALAQLEPQARAKSLELIFLDETAGDLVVAVDEDRLRQVLLNLLGNAVKFTHAGSVSLETAYDASTEHLAIKVTDTGPGIAPSQVDRLFDRYTQADDPSTREYAGAGLGLAICKRLVEGMGGEIGVTSAPGQGGCFSLWVPAPRHEAVDGAGAKPARPRIRVLVADRDAAVHKLVNRSLESLDAEVLTAVDGDETLKLAAHEALDLILMELDLPKDARAVLRRLRRKRGPNTMTPVLALTGPQGRVARDEMLEGGFQGMIAKPFSPSELVSAVAHAFALARLAAVPKPPPRARGVSARERVGRLA